MSLMWINIILLILFFAAFMVALGYAISDYTLITKICESMNVRAKIKGGTEPSDN